MLDRFLEGITKPSNAPTLRPRSTLNNKPRERQNEQVAQLHNYKQTKVPREQLKLIISTWETDSTAEMFDYENKGIKKKEHLLDQNCDLYLSDIDKKYARCIVTKANTPNHHIYAGTVHKSKGQFYFTPGTRLEAYRVVRADNVVSNCIREGNQIKIGRMKYQVRETYDGHQLRAKPSIKTETSDIIKITSEAKGTCKFCLCDEKDSSGLLISPCSCRGSCAQVHLQCLREWLANKVTRKSTTTVEFLNYDNFSCEICQDELPTVMQVNDKVYDILKAETKADCPYILLEGILSDKTASKNNLTIKINFRNGKDSIIVGRGHDADVRLDDVSISRQHCFIKFTGRQFELVDNGSKFGTLIRIEPKEDINLRRNLVQVAKVTLQAQPELYSKYGLQEKENMLQRR